jgi:hypothetical protein
VVVKVRSAVVLEAGQQRLGIAEDVGCLGQAGGLEGFQELG